MNGNKPDMEKRLYWRRILEEAATSGISTREFCRQRRLKETQFYWWRRMLKSGGQERRGGGARGGGGGGCCLCVGGGGARQGDMGVGGCGAAAGCGVGPAGEG